MQTWATQVRKGLIELWMLGHISQGRSYGYQLQEVLFENGVERVPGPTIYRVLMRLRREGWITVHDGYSPLGPRRRYCRISAKGAQRLRQMKSAWQGMALATEKAFGAKTLIRLPGVSRTRRPRGADNQSQPRTHAGASG